MSAAPLLPIPCKTIRSANLTYFQRKLVGSRLCCCAPALVPECHCDFLCSKTFVFQFHIFTHFSCENRVHNTCVPYICRSIGDAAFFTSATISTILARARQKCLYPQLNAMVLTCVHALMLPVALVL